MPRFINPVPQYTNAAGVPLIAGEMFFYEVASTTPKDVYLDAALAIPATNPVLLNADGSMPDRFLSGTYRTVLVEPSTGQRWERDNVGSDSILGYGADWDSTVTYGAPDVVLFDSIYYTSKTNNNIGNAPDVNPSNWEALAQFTPADEVAIYTGVPFWDVTRAYLVGNLTNVGGVLYKCLTNDTGTNPVGDLTGVWVESFVAAVGDQRTISVWGNFTGTGVVTINESFNIFSIVDEGVGDYGVTFINDLNTATYSTVVGYSASTPLPNRGVGAHGIMTDGFQITAFVTNTGTLIDIETISFQLFGGQ